MLADGFQDVEPYMHCDNYLCEIGMSEMSLTSQTKNKARVASMRQSVSRAVGLAGLTVAVSLPGAGIDTTDAQEKRDITRSLQQVQSAVKKAAPSTLRTTRPGGAMAQWSNWQNWNNWRNY